ncbi:hypothetical protein V8D89_007157 [Ganoderma adspersum]
MEADAPSIPGLVSQLELSVERNLADLGRSDAVSLEDRLRVLLWEVRGHSNALAPINSLPPEMLTVIFRAVVNACARPPEFLEPDSIRAIHHPDQKRVDMRPQFRLAHVCRLWRSAALGDASLWSHVDVAYPKEAVEFLLRSSAGCPLTLYVSAGKARLVEKIMQDHGARVCAVYLSRKGSNGAGAGGNGIGMGMGMGVMAAGQQFHLLLNAALGPQAGAALFGPQAGAGPLNNPAAAFFNPPGPAPLNNPVAAFFNPVAAFFNPPAAPLPPPGGVPFAPPAVPFFPGAAAFNAAPFLPGQAQAPPGAQFPGPPPIAAALQPLVNGLLSTRDTEETSGSILKDFCSCAPRLECFTLREHRHGSMHSFGLRRGWYSQPSESPLRALALILAEDYFPASSFPNLTHLYLSFPLRRSQVQESMKSLFQMLSRTPQLQFLQLSSLRAVAAAPDGFIIPLPQVSLDQLHFLVLCDVQLEMAFNLLKYLTLPESVLLSIGGDEGIRGFQVNGLPPSLRLPPLAQLNAFTFMEISVDFHKFLLTGYDAQFATGFVLKTNDYNQFWSTSWLPELHDMLSLSRITVLHINDNGGRALPQLLPYFTELEELSILLLQTVQGLPGVVQTARALFSSLTPLTTLVCPALRFVGLEAGVGHAFFPCVELQAMAVGRHQRGLPIRRFVYQWHGVARPWSTAEAKEKEQMSLVEAKLSPLLQPYVDSIEYRLSSVAEKVCPFVPRECWRIQVPDAEKYWRGERPSYGMPWEKRSPGERDPVRLRLGEPQVGDGDEPESESEMRLEDLENFDLGLPAQWTPLD